MQNMRTVHGLEFIYTTIDAQTKTKLPRGKSRNQDLFATGLQLAENKKSGRKRNYLNNFFSKCDFVANTLEH